MKWQSTLKRQRDFTSSVRTAEHHTGLNFGVLYGNGRTWQSRAQYLHRCHSYFPSNQNPAFLQLGDVRILQFHKIHHQVCNVKLPVWAQQVAQLTPRARTLSYELCEDSHRGVLVLQSASSSFPLIFILIITVSGRSFFTRKGSIKKCFQEHHWKLTLEC